MRGITADKDDVVPTLAEVPTQLELDCAVDPSREAAMEQARRTVLLQQADSLKNKVSITLAAVQPVNVSVAPQ